MPKNAQEAHEAIRPTISKNNIFKDPDSTDLDGIGRQLYELIYRRTIASVMAASQTITTSYFITAFPSEEQFNSRADSRIDNATIFDNIQSMNFRASSSYVKFPGFLAAYGRVKENADMNSLELSEEQQLYLQKQVFDDMRFDKLYVKITVLN